jgi:hypothetical protein
MSDLSPNNILLGHHGASRAIDNQIFKETEKMEFKKPTRCKIYTERVIHASHKIRTAFGHPTITDFGCAYDGAPGGMYNDLTMPRN